MINWQKHTATYANDAGFMLMDLMLVNVYMVVRFQATKI